jgi:hypothetical protein
MVISLVLSSKFLSPILIAGPVGTLAIALVAAGTGMSSSIIGGVVEEVEARFPFFLRGASGSGTKLSSKLKPLMHYFVFIHNRRKHRRLACMSKWLPYMHAIMNISYWSLTNLCLPW